MVEQSDTVTEQHRREVDLHLVKQPGTEELQRGLRAHQVDALLARCCLGLRRGNRSGVLPATFIFWTRTRSGRKVLEGRGFVSTDHVCEQFGKCDRRVVFVERTYDLCADGESARRSPYGRSYGGQAWQRRVRHPEGLVVIGPLAFGRGDRAVFEGSSV